MRVALSEGSGKRQAVDIRRAIATSSGVEARTVSKQIPYLTTMTRTTPRGPS